MCNWITSPNLWSVWGRNLPVCACMGEPICWKRDYSLFKIHVYVRLHMVSMDWFLWIMCLPWRRGDTKCPFQAFEYILRYLSQVYQWLVALNFEAILRRKRHQHIHHFGERMSICSATAAASSRPRRPGRSASTTRASFTDQIMNDRTERLRRLEVILIAWTSMSHDMWFPTMWLFW